MLYMFSTMNANKEAHLSSCIHGYNIYNAIWSGTVGEELQCANGSWDAKDRYAISILRRQM